MKINRGTTIINHILELFSKYGVQKVRKIITILLLAFILINPIALARDVVLITSGADSHSSCDMITNDDEDFCERLELLGYDVEVYNDDEVVANHPDWQLSASQSDMIFVGSVSSDYCGGTDTASFCGIIDDYTSNAVYIMTECNNMKDDSTQGCSFIAPFEYGTWLSEDDDNYCTGETNPTNFRKLKEHYITTNVETIDQFNNTNLYTSDPSKIRLSEKGTTDLLGISCSPGLAGPGIYSMLRVKEDEGVFWGLSDPEKYNNYTWEVFDRTIWYILDEDDWNITSYTIPTTPTVNQSFWLVSEVELRRDPVVSGIVNYTVGGLNGNLAYQYDSIWKRADALINETGLKTIYIKGYENSNLLSGEEEISVNVGNLIVNITSGSYVPASNYTVVAKVYNSTGDPVDATSVSFKIRDVDNLDTVLKSGSLGCTDNVCSVLVSNTEGWLGNKVIGVSANYGKQKGGSFKIIGEAQDLNGTITLSPAENFQPQDSVAVNFSTLSHVINASRYVRGPDGEVVNNKVSMTKVKDGEFNSSFIIPDSAKNGTHVLYIEFSDGAKIETLQKNFDVAPYSISTTLDKLKYSAGETMKATTQILSSYRTSGLNISVDLSLVDPDDELTEIDSGNITLPNETLSIEYDLPSSLSSGEYQIKFDIVDNYNRTFEIYEDFTLGTSSLVTVTPTLWKLSVTESGTYSKIFKINNTGSLDVENITISLVNASVSLSNTSLGNIEAGESVNFTATWSTSTKAENFGKILIKSVNNTIGTIKVELNYSETAEEDYIDVSPSSLSITTIPDKVSTHEFIIENTGSVEIDNLEFEVDEDLEDIIIVKDKPLDVDAESSEKLEIEIDTADLDVGDYSGSIKITSSGGNFSISISIEIIPDLTEDPDGLLDKLKDLASRISSMADTGVDVSEFESDGEKISALFEDAVDAYNDGDYETAMSKYTETAEAIRTLESKITQATATEEAPKKASNLIWIIAIIVILIIIGVTAYTYREKLKEVVDQLMEQLNKGKGKKSKKEEPEYSEDDYPGYAGDEYRTDYY